MKKRITSILLCLCMVMTLLPATAWAADAHASHPVCGATCTHGSEHNAVEWTPLTKEMIDSASTDAYNIQSGNYYLTENIETEKGITVGQLSTSNINVNICFNGHTIICSNNQENRTSQIYVNKNSSLTLCDCQGGGGFSSAEGVTRPLYWTDGTFNLYGGTLSGKGGTAYNAASSLNLYGGTLSNTTNTVHGSFTLDGASIETTTSYAINAQATSTVLIKSGSVTSAGSPSVLVYTSNFTMEGGTVTNTKTTGSPYAIEFTSTGGGTISGGVIKAEYKDSSGINAVGPNPVVLSGNPTIEGPKADIRIGANGKLTVGDNLTGEYTVNYSSPNNITEAAPYSFTTGDSKDNSAYFKASTVASTSGLALRNSGEGDAQTVQIYRPHLLKAYSAKEATCTEDGNEAYWQCTNVGCGKLFSDANGGTELSEIPTIAAKSHDLVHHAAVEPECVTAGNREYWTCSVCNKIFSDASGKTEISSIPVNPGSGHSWGAWTITTEPTLTAAGTAERVCTKNGKHKDSATLPALTDTTVWTEGTKVEPTEEAGGSQEYTSEYGTVTVTIPATPAAPTVVSRTDTTLTIMAESGQEYSIDGSTWQDGGTFTGLTANKDYTIYTRVKATSSSFASESVSISVTTKGTQTAPAAPSGLTATDGSVTVPNSVDGQQYIILSAGETPEESHWDDAKTGNGGGLSFANLDPATEYVVYTRLPGSDDLMPSEASSTSVTTAAKTTGSASEGITVDYKDEKITIKDGYEVSTSPDFTGILTNPADLEPGQTYYVRVKEKDGIPASDAVTYTAPARPETPSGITVSDETIQDKGDGVIAGITADMEYSTDGGRNWESGPATLTGLAGSTEVIVRVAATDSAPHGEAQTYTVRASAVTLTVTFDSNGGSEVEAITGLSYNAAVNAPDAPTKANSNFGGWYTDAGCTQAWSFSVNKVTDNLTLYAKWKQVAFTVDVNIYTDSTKNIFVTESVGLVLMKGSEKLEEGTATNGTYKFKTHVPAGAYNVVATFGSGADAQTRTALVTIAVDSQVEIIKPVAGANSHLTVAKDTDTPAVVVGGLDTEAETLKTNDVEKVSVSMAVEGQKEAEVQAPVVTAIEAEIEKNTTLQGNNPVVEYLDVTMSKAVTTSDGSTNESAITETTNLIELVIPFPGGRKNPVVICHHDGKAEAMQKNPTSGGEGFKVDEASETLHIYTKKFSTYAIAYTTEYTITFDPNGGDGGTTTGQTNSNGTVTLPTNPSRSGYTFKGWYTAASGGTQVTNSYVFSGNTTIYAQWTQNSTNTGGGGGGVSTYAITVEDAEGGSVKSDRTRASYGSTVTITVTPDEGYKLGGLIVTDASGRKIEVTDKGDGKYTFKMPGGKVTISVTYREIDTSCDGGVYCPQDETCPVYPFTDTDINAWYHDGVHFCIENGLMGSTSTTESLFAPDTTTSRAMIVTILHRLEGAPVSTAANIFSDVPDGQWYTDAVIWAAEHKIVEGYNGYFNPNDPITREQFAAFLYRYAQHKGIDVSVGEDTNILSYEDALTVSEYAIPAMQWACGAGIIGGMNSANGGMILDPQGNATRAQAAVMLTRFCEKVK